MKKSLIAAAALAALATSAHAQTAGYVGANYTRSNLNPAGPGDVRLDQYQLEGAGAWTVQGLGVAVDGQITDVGGDPTDKVDYALTAHVNTRAFGGALLGGFAGVDSNDALTVWGLGFEGQTKVGDTNTLYGQIGYGSSDQLGNPDLWAGRVELRHFYKDNIKVQGSVGYIHANTDAGNFDSWNLGVEGEYQFAGTPWSVIAGYDYAKSHDLQTTDNIFRVGGRYTFGGGSLKARDAAGADLNPLRRLFTGVTRF